MTYQELHEKSNQIAGVLRKKGVNQDQIIAIMVENSFEMISGLLGILKAGAAYLPSDYDYPEERIEYLITDSKVKIILTQSSFVERIQFSDVHEVINLEDKTLYLGQSKNIENINQPTDLAYILYTSDSTGKNLKE